MNMSETTLDETALRSWVGKSETMVDTVHADPARFMEATLDRAPSLKIGDELPPTWHWLYFLTAAPLSQLGQDGHAALGEFLPPIALPRRMWAGGRMEFKKPILLGETITKRSVIKDVTLKEGRSGKLCFVTLNHEYCGQSKDLRLMEEQDLVYREGSAAGTQTQPAVTPPASGIEIQKITPTSVQLFRYSALTFNSHRIHYDRDYCQNVENYPGLVYHGPLTATLLADSASHRHGRLKSFSYRAVAPLFDAEPFTIHDSGTGELWAQTPQGGLAMRAEVSFV